MSSPSHHNQFCQHDGVQGSQCITPGVQLVVQHQCLQQGQHGQPSMSQDFQAPCFFLPMPCQQVWTGPPSIDPSQLNGPQCVQQSLPIQQGLPYCYTVLHSGQGFQQAQPWPVILNQFQQPSFAAGAQQTQFYQSDITQVCQPNQSHGCAGDVQQQPPSPSSTCDDEAKPVVIGDLPFAGSAPMKPSVVNQDSPSAGSAPMKPSVVNQDSPSVGSTPMKPRLTNFAASQHGSTPKGSSPSGSSPSSSAGAATPKDRPARRHEGNSSSKKNRKGSGSKDLTWRPWEDVNTPYSPGPKTCTPQLDCKRILTVLKDATSSSDQVKQEIAALKGKVWSASRDKDGTWAVQEAFEKADKATARELADELRGHVVDAAYHSEANFVLRKMMERLPREAYEFIPLEITDECVKLAKHERGCRTLCQLFAFAPEQPATIAVVDRLLQDAEQLCVNQWGNHVVQKVIEHGSESQVSRIEAVMAIDPKAYSQHKFAAYVVDALLSKGYCERLLEVLASSKQTLVELALLPNSGFTVAYILLHGMVDEEMKRSVLTTLGTCREMMDVKVLARFVENKLLPALKTTAVCLEDGP